jgi:hypothetical protein
VRLPLVASPAAGRRWRGLVVLFVVGVLAARPVEAASILSVSFADLTQRAEFIFEGRVIEVAARPVPGFDAIQTCASFLIAEILKGSHPGDRIELCFLGGTLGDERMEVPGIRYPTEGERGVYFVETLSRQQINPLLGWTQGQFLVAPSSEGGPDTVTTVDGSPVIGLRSDIDPPKGLSNGVAKGVTIGPGDGTEAAMTLRDFKSRVADILKPKQ